MNPFSSFQFPFSSFLFPISFLPLIGLYAETHYHIKLLKPRYYRKQPEILADVPIRTSKKNNSILPVLLIVKDANLFPILLKKVEIKIIGRNRKINVIKQINKNLSQKYFSETLNINLNQFKPEQTLFITVKFHIEQNSKKYIVLNDNYKNLSKKPFRTYFAEHALPYPENWFAGEPHYHSNYTSDQVEFGADIPSTKEMAKALGLSWFFVTDHSYDLDDKEDDYLINDTNIPKWKKMKDEVKKHNTKDFRIIHGEEVSIGNADRKNVHLLAINHEEFIEGHGDSAEKWFRNKPTTKIAEITNYKIQNTNKSQIINNQISNKPISNPKISNQKSKSLFIAAHPNERIPFLQKMTLRRGNWQLKDYLQSGIKFLQIINNSDLRLVDKSIAYWKNLLLKGHKFFILAGNDAHGNFNVMRQIKIPYWKLFSSQNQVFGKFLTVFNFPENDPIKGIQSGKTIISSGPFLDFWLEAEKQKYEIGSTVKLEKAKLCYETATSPEFGKIASIDLFIGDNNLHKEKKVKDPLNNAFLILPKKGYLRMSLSTSKMGRVFTNPIWMGINSESRLFIGTNNTEQKTEKNNYE